jgi:hypothetical protein
MLARFRRQGKLLVYLVLFLDPCEDRPFCKYFVSRLICANLEKIKAAKSQNCIIDEAGIITEGEHLLVCYKGGARRTSIIPDIQSETDPIVINA